MKALFFFSFFIFCTTCLATGTIVTVDISACGKPGQTFSGQIIEFQGQEYVISTSWAQISRSSPMSGCELIKTEQGPLKTTPIATDHLAGLSVFLVHRDLVDNRAFEKLARNTGATLHSRSSNGTLQSFPGQILLKKSRRHDIPALAEAIEWKSVAPSLSSQILGGSLLLDDQWMGVISHQYMERPKGRPLQVFSWDLKSGSGHDHVVVIPKEFVLVWLQNQLVKPHEPVIWPPEKQLQGVLTYIVGGYQITADCPSSDEDSDHGDYPIGGHDGFGIGGGDPQRSSCKIQATKSQTASAWENSKFSEWLKLSSSKMVEVIYTLNRNETGSIQSGSFSSLENFLSSLVRGSNTDWIEINQQDNSLDNLQVVSKNLRRELLECTTDIYIQDAEVYELVRRLYLLTWAGTSVSASKLRALDIYEAMDRDGAYKQGWKFLEWEGACLNRIRPAADRWNHEILKKW